MYLYFSKNSQMFEVRHMLGNPNVNFLNQNKAQATCESQVHPFGSPTCVATT